MYHAGLKSIKTLKSWMKYCELASDFATLKGNTHLWQLIIDRWVYHQNINSPLMLLNVPLIKTLKSWMKYCELASDFATLKGNTHLWQLIIDRWVYHQNINSPLMLLNVPLIKNRSLVTYTFKQRSTVIHLLAFSIDSAY